MGSLIGELRRRPAPRQTGCAAGSGRLRRNWPGREEQVSRLAIVREEVTRVREEPAAGLGGKPPGGLADRGGDGAAVQDLLEVAADAGRLLRAGELAVAAGLAREKAKVEGLRSKLRLLAARGWLAAVPGGLFMLPDHAGKTGKPGQ